MLKKIKDFLNKPIPAFEKIDLTKKYPRYFNKFILRSFYFVIALIIIADFIIGGGFTSFSYTAVSKGNNTYCTNEFYVCNNEEMILSPFKHCLTERPSYHVCNIVDCDSRLIPCGHYGRNDFLHRFGYTTIIFLFIGAFATNHLYYLWRKK